MDAPQRTSPKSLEGLDGEYLNHFEVGGVSVEVAGEYSHDVALAPSLNAFQVSPVSPDLNIRIEWTDRLASSAAPPLFDSGATWILYENEPGLRFDFITPALGSQPYKRLLVDRGFRLASLQMSEESFKKFCLTAKPLEYPLDELLIMHRLTQERAIELHGVGIVGPNGASNLFLGHSGAGKSTTARLWSDLHKVNILSDDRIIVREDKVRDGASEIFMYGTPWHGEAHFALPDRAPLQRILVLEHGHGNALTRLSPSQAVAELFARAFVPFHRHEYVDHALAFLQHVAGSIPCYRYSFEPDERAVDTILNFHD